MNNRLAKVLTFDVSLNIINQKMEMKQTYREYMPNRASAKDNNPNMQRHKLGLA